MNCSSCGHDNPEHAKFCLECGAPASTRCVSCGTELPAAAKFCLECGAKVGRRAATTAPPASIPASTRKVVSIIFADLMGSTALHERLDPESVNRVMDAYYRAVRGPVEAAGGSVVQLLGDGVLCAFGIPQIAQDDALRAVRAAVGIQHAFRQFLAKQQWLSVPIGLRVAVNTGEVVVSQEHPAGIGDPLNVAARLQQEARDGEVLIGQATQRLVTDAVTLEQAGVFALKGRAESVAAYRVVSLERPAGRATAVFVGRDVELTRITAVYEAACAAPAARLAVLLGSPGLGKSRLIDEVGRRLGDANVLMAQCDAAGGATFAPIAEALRRWIDAVRTDQTPSDPAAALAELLPDSSDRGRILAGIGALLAGSPAPPEETFFVIRRFLTGLAQSAPVVLVIDDLHWGEALLLDLVEHLIQWGSGVPLFVLVGARPELREMRSSLVTSGALVSDVVTLAGLDAGAATRLAANVIGASDLPAAVAAKVLATSEGNPLFVGELVRMFVDEGALEREGERWIVGANLAALEMPPTIHALLAARIERLRPEERAVLERAAVVGRHFSRSAVAALIGDDGSDLDPRLEALRRSELIEPDSGWFLGEPVLRFHHVLIRDAAYRRLLKGTRAELHARFADWVRNRASEAADHDETIGWHLEQAHQLLLEIGPLDDSGRAFGEQAARHLAAAGRRALGRDDLPVAADLLGRAIDRLDADDAARADLALDWCEALLSAGDVGGAATAIAELGRFAGADVPGPRSQVPGLGSSVPIPDSRFPNPGGVGQSRLRAWHTCFTSQLTALVAPEKLQAAADAVTDAAGVLAKLGDDAGEAKAHSVRAQALARLGKVGASEAALDQALAAARKAGDRRRANAVLAGAPLAALWGPSPVTRASGRCLDVVRVLRITQGAPAVEAVALSCQGVLEALRGRTDAARRMLASSRKMVEDLGIAQRLFEVDVLAGRIELLEGNAAGAERQLRGAYEGLRDLGLGIDAARAGAMLARTLLAQNRVEEAEALSHESERLAGDDLQASIAWRGVRAEALAKRGEHAAAVDLAEAAVTIAAATDALLDHADARVALAAALRAASRSAECDAEERRAIELWEAKGATLLVERAGQREPHAPAAPRERDALDRPGVSEGTAPASGAGALPASRRRVRANLASAEIARFESSFKAGDTAAYEEEFAATLEVIAHPTGASYGREGHLDSLRRLARGRDPELHFEPLATLGDTLVLARRRVAASGATGPRYDVGAYERVEIVLTKVGADGRAAAIEIFATDRLGDAIARLFEHHAALLPDGAERRRTAAIAGAAAACNGETDTDRLEPAMAASCTCIDHRPLGLWRAGNAKELLAHLRSQWDLAASFAVRDDDVLGLGPDAYLVRRVYHGSARGDGGAYENHVLELLTFGADGLLAGLEIWEPERESEALARFDEVAATGAPGGVLASIEPQPQRRRVRANAATVYSDRLRAAVARRDLAAIRSMIASGMEVIHHPSGLAYGAREGMERFRLLFQASELSVRYENLAILGESLSLFRDFTSFSGLEDKGLQFGPSTSSYLNIGETHSDGNLQRIEIFAEDRLGDAIAALYKRYAELLPEGRDRIRAAATARSVAALFGPLDRDRMASAIAPSIKVVDHQLLGTWSARGADELLRHLDAWPEVGEGHHAREDDVLALEPHALLLKSTAGGNDRQGGGPFGGEFLNLCHFGNDGRLLHWELFDVERRAEALARFDELVAGPSAVRPVRRVRRNAAAENSEGIVAALAAADVEGASALLADSVEVRHHPTGSVYGRAETVETFRRTLLVPSGGIAIQREGLASLGNALALSRQLFSIESVEDRDWSVGASELEEVFLEEVDAEGRRSGLEIFATHQLGEAIVRLYARYAELLPEGPARTRAATTADSLALMTGPLDPDRLAAAMDPRMDCIDHRSLATRTTRGADELVAHYRLQADLAANFTARVDDVLALTPSALLERRIYLGNLRDTGGAFEKVLLLLTVFGTDGRVVRSEVWETDQEGEALARFDAIVAADGEPGGRTPRRDEFANLATGFNERVVRAWQEGDWATIERLRGPGYHIDDRRRLPMREVATTSGEAMRVYFEVPGSRLSITPIATRGEHLCLSRSICEANVDESGGSLAIEPLVVDEVDGDGRSVEAVFFDPDDLDAAYAEIDARWAAGEGATHGAHVRLLTAFGRAVTSRDWDPVLSLCAPAFVEHDHRHLAVIGTTHGAAAWAQNFRTLTDLAPDTVYRIDHVRSGARGLWCVGTWCGTREGGPYELPINAVLEMDAHDRLARADIYEPEQLDAARARFDQLRLGRIAG